MSENDYSRFHESLAEHYRQDRNRVEERFTSLWTIATDVLRGIGQSSDPAIQTIRDDAAKRLRYLIDPQAAMSEIMMEAFKRPVDDSQFRSQVEEASK